MAKNHVHKSGGGIYLYSSRFICENYCNFSDNQAIMKGDLGGAIHAIYSTIELTSECNECISESNLIICNNSATLGGGIYFEANSKLRLGSNNLDSKYKITFEHNHAIKGVAIYIDDESYHAACTEHYNIILNQCVLQTSYPYSQKNQIRLLVNNYTINNLKTNHIWRPFTQMLC